MVEVKQWRCSCGNVLGFHNEEALLLGNAQVFHRIRVRCCACSAWRYWNPPKESETPTVDRIVATG